LNIKNSNPHRLPLPPDLLSNSDGTCPDIARRSGITLLDAQKIVIPESSEFDGII
jgi:hypothetical protein